MIRLKSITGRKTYCWYLDHGKYILGRSSQCDLSVDDNTISKRHAQIEVVDKNTINLTDTESRNGTFVNGEKIVDTIQLFHNDIITMGSIELKLTVDENSETAENLVNITDFYDKTTEATKVPIEEALQPLASEITNDPKIFNAFSEIAKMLILPDPEDEMLSRSLRLLQQILPIERDIILIIEENEIDILSPTFCVASEGCESSFNISRTILEEVINQKNAILISEPQSNSKYSQQQSIIKSRIQYAMAVPLYDEGKIFGVLYADTTNPNHQYTENHLRITATFANILAAKMVNYNLLKEKQAKDILETELLLASRIQERLMPKEYPVIENYQFDAFQVQCRQVGGDLFDIAQLDDGRLILLEADVSGKGVGAALLASNILASFRILYNTKNFNIMEATCNVSKKLLEFTRTGDFATLFICTLNPRTNILQYINAGCHNHPMIIRNDGKIEYLKASGIPIGAINTFNWKEESCDMKAGDLLFAFTDGISEAANSKGEQFGENKLENILQNNRHQSPEKLTKLIKSEVDRFIEENPQSDDLTMMILRRER